MAKGPIPKYQIGDLMSFNKDRQPTHAIVDIQYYPGKEQVMFSFDAIYLKNSKRRRFYVIEDIQACWSEECVAPVGHDPTLRLLYGQE